jgi:hypothetical protein
VFIFRFVFSEIGTGAGTDAASGAVRLGTSSPSRQTFSILNASYSAADQLSSQELVQLTSPARPGGAGGTGTGTATATAGVGAFSPGRYGHGTGTGTGTGTGHRVHVSAVDTPVIGQPLGRISPRPTGVTFSLDSDHHQQDLQDFQRGGPGETTGRNAFPTGHTLARSTDSAPSAAGGGAGGGMALGMGSPWTPSATGSTQASSSGGGGGGGGGPGTGGKYSNTHSDRDRDRDRDPPQSPGLSEYSYLHDEDEHPGAAYISSPGHSHTSSNNSLSRSLSASFGQVVSSAGPRSPKSPKSAQKKGK